MRNKPPEKPLSVEIGLSNPDRHEISQIVIKADGSLVVLNSEGNAVQIHSSTRTVQYPRKNKANKVQVSAAMPGALPSVGGIAELTRFTSLFAIDTNTPKENGSPSITCAIEFRITRQGDDHILSAEPSVKGYEFHDAPGRQEMLGALKLANDVISSRGLSPSFRFGLVTDSHLGEHDAINARTAPLYGSHMLPPCFELLYASADTGRDVLNSIIRLCDKEATAFQRWRKGASHKPTLRPLAEDGRVRFADWHRDGLEVVNPIVQGMSAQGGTYEVFVSMD